MLHVLQKLHSVANAKRVFMMTGIVPKNEAHGVDFCGVDKYYYIVRSDLNCFMRSTNFNKGEDLNIITLHPSCRDGDHYLAHQDGYFYIIKGNNFRRVTDLSSDENAVVNALHPNCQGGDHYLSAFGCYFIIYQSRGVYRRTENMKIDKNGCEFTLHPNCKDGLYYFGIKGHCYFVKPHDEWGLQYYRCSDYNKDYNGITFSFYPSVINFLPGGLAITKGPSFVSWECIKTIFNDSDTPVTWSKKIVKRLGYENKKMSSLGNNWKIAPDVSGKTGGLIALITKAQFSLKGQYGGSKVNTNRENWTEATEVEESLSVTLEPNKSLYIWQCKLGLGCEVVLHHRDTRITDTPTPPTDIPLPLAEPNGGASDST
uniref:Uncharacterized protein n=2 Tax=Xenopus tropicalis TaxID=8364 RepID=A0A803JYB0_XENTR